MPIFKPLIVLLLTLLVFLAFVCPENIQSPPKLQSINGKAQGTTYTIKYIHAESFALQSDIDSLLSEIDNSLSLYKKTSLISLFNASTKGVKFDDHLLFVVSSSLMFSSASQHSFDITSRPISLLWGFDTASLRARPNTGSLKTALQHVGSHHLSFRNDSLLKDDPMTLLDCDGVAQGYTVDQLSKLLLRRGINNFMVELGGEIFTSGQNLDGNSWVIGIEDPVSFMAGDHFLSKKVALSGLAITTSGSLRKFRKLGKRYFSHIMDPRTGFPVDNGIVSVTVIAKDAIAADAYDNAFMVLGLDNSFKLFDVNKSIGFYIVYTKPDGSLADTANAYFKRFLLK